MNITDRYQGVLQWFQRNSPHPQTELHYDTPFQLLVAVILSAQCTDKRVNEITPKLFQRFPTVQAMADATPEEVLEYVKSASYPNSKANYLVGTARKLIALFNGQVPNNVDQLQQLPGVGRKTANVIAAVVYGQPTMAVDTHVFRVANRIGLTDNSKSPLQTEQTLTQYISQQVIADAHHWLILHGRYVCTARNPKCTTCGIKHWCQEYEKNQG